MSQAYETVDEITCEYRHGSGQLRRREVFKQVISNRCGWATIVFAWQDWRTKGNVRNPGWQPVRFAIERWRRIGERWRRETRVSLRQEDARAALALIGGLDVEQLVAAVEDSSAA